MDALKGKWNRINTRLEAYVKVEGDTPDTVLQKKIWWLLNAGSAPILMCSILFMGRNLGDAVFYVNILFFLLLFFPLVLFHFYRTHIEAYALFSQVMIVTLTAIKVFLMGGMMQAGTPVYVGLIAPVYALILPKKNRAVLLFILYTLAMIGATLANPHSPGDYVFYKYFMGFLISNSAIFFTLYYFTTQWEKAKQAEKDRLQELDELKTKYYASIAHDIRTPLGIIEGMADQMKEHPSKWLEAGHQIIQQNCFNITRLTELFNLSKPTDRRELQIRLDRLIHARKHLQKHYRIDLSRGRNGSASRHGNTDADSFLHRIQKILMDHLDQEDFGIQELCGIMGMSRSQLYRKFAAITDITLNGYLISLRLSRARELLETTDLNVSEVAWDTGFKNPSHFSRAFSNAYGYAPSQARQKSIISNGTSLRM